MKIHFSLGYVVVGFAIALISCGKDAAETVADAVTAKVSCNYQEAGYCIEYLTDNYTGSDKDTCTNSRGLYAASACPDSGKVKGCELTTNGLKVTRTWGYSDLGVISVDSSCNAVVNQNNPSFKAEYITP